MGVQMDHKYLVQFNDKITLPQHYTMKTCCGAQTHGWEPNSNLTCKLAFLVQNFQKANFLKINPPHLQKCNHPLLPSHGLGHRCSKSCGE